MVTIVTDMMIFGLKTCIFLKKNFQKRSKILKIGLENCKIRLFLPPNRPFWGRNAAEKYQNSTKNRKTRKLVETKEGAQAAIDARESHEGQTEQAGADEHDGHSAHALGDVG